MEQVMEQTMQKLNFVEECIRTVNYKDLEKFIASVLEQNVKVEWEHNDSTERYLVERLDHAEDLYEWQEYLDLKNKPVTADTLYIDGRVMIPGALIFSEYEVDTVLNGLCTEGYLEAGDYLVEVSW